MTAIDIVVVSYNSRENLRTAVLPLVAAEGVRVIVVDNASRDGSIEAVSDLDVTVIALSSNRGFAAGCNAGWRAGDAPFVLLLNPDARIVPEALRRLVEHMESDSSIGATGPRIEEEGGGLDLSQRRFPRLSSTYAQALFLHRLFPRAQWTDEVIRDETAYQRPGSPEWLSGACLLVRRDVLEEIGGLDDGFFMYCEDIDLCRRIRDAGWSIGFDPAAVCVHKGGGSGDRRRLLSVLTTSRIRYARLHRGRMYVALERAGIALAALTHLVVGKGGLQARAAHARSLAIALRHSPAGNASQEAR